MELNKTTLNQTSKSILNILEKWNKNKNLNKEIYSEQDVKSSLTVNLIAEEIEKEPIPAVYKKYDIVHKSLIELSKSEDNRLPIIFIYPFLLESKDQTLLARVAVVLVKSEKTISSLRKSCFNLSLSAINLFFSKYAEKETNSSKYNEYRLSTIEQIKTLLTSGFNPYPYIEQNLFMEDCLNYGVNQDVLIRIWNNYCILKKQYSNEHFCFHLQEVSKGAELFLFDKVFPLDALSENLKILLENYKHGHLEADFFDSKKKCNNEKIENLLSILDSLKSESSSLNLSSEQEKKLIEKINNFYNIIISLKSLSEQTLELEDNDSKELLKEILKKVEVHTEKNLDFYELNLIEFIQNKNFDNVDYANQIKNQILNSIYSNSNFLLKKIPNKASYICVDCAYLEAVLKNLEIRVLREEDLDITLFKLKILKSEIVRLKQLEHTNSKVTTDIMKELESQSQVINHQLRERSSGIFEKFNIKACINSFIVIVVISNLLSFYFNNYFISMTGLFIGLILSIFFGFFIKKNKRSKALPSSKDVISHNKNPAESKGANKSQVSENQKSKLARKLGIESEAILFPKDFKKIEDKIYNIESLRSRLEQNVGQIQKKLKSDLLPGTQDDVEGLIASLEHTALQNIARINIPPALRVPGKPNEILISHKDLKYELPRNQIAEHYRSLLEKNKGNKKLFKYYQLIINSIELEYYKYLPKGI